MNCDRLSAIWRGHTDVYHRAEIRTSDEFGVLARDLNLFLDRITGIVSELDAVLAKVLSANDDIIAVQVNLRQTVDRIVSGVRQLERDAMLSAKSEPRLLTNGLTQCGPQSPELDQALAQVDHPHRRPVSWRPSVRLCPMPRPRLPAARPSILSWLIWVIKAKP